MIFFCSTFPPIASNVRVVKISSFYFLWPSPIPSMSFAYSDIGMQADWSICAHCRCYGFILVFQWKGPSAISSELSLDKFTQKLLKLKIRWIKSPFCKLIEQLGVFWGFFYFVVLILPYQIRWLIILVRGTWNRSCLTTKLMYLV